MKTDYTKQSIAQLRQLHIDITETIAAQKQMLAGIEAELLRRHGPTLRSLFDATGKQAGELSTELDGLKVTYAIKAKTKWDNDQLMAVASTMPWDKAQKVFKIEFSVPERIYKAITDDDLLAKITQARTVEYSEPKVTFAK